MNSAALSSPDPAGMENPRPDSWCPDNHSPSHQPSVSSRQRWVSDPDNLPEVVPHLREPLSSQQVKEPEIVPQQSEPSSQHEKEQDEMSQTFDNMSVGPGHESEPRGWRGFARKARKMRCPIIGIVIFFLVIAGVIVGAYFGNTLSKNQSDNSPAPGLHHATVARASNIEMALAGTPEEAFRLLIFQDRDGCLVAVEWHGPQSDTYFITDRFSGDAPPKPIRNTALSTAKFGIDGDVHLFYFDERLRFAHIIRRAGFRGQQSWNIGGLSVGSGRVSAQFNPSKKMRLSATVLSSELTEKKVDSLLVMYHTDADGESVAILSSTSPDVSNSWTSSSFSLGVTNLGLKPYPESESLLIHPIFRLANPEDKQSTVPGVRIVWDLDDESHKAAFGMLDCTFTDELNLDDCEMVVNDWSDTKAESWVLDAVKPLRFSLVPLVLESPDVIQHIIRIVDYDGNMIELLWNSTSWVDHRTFSIYPQSLPPGFDATITDAASAGDDLLFANTADYIMQLARPRPWWKAENSGGVWTLVDIVDFRE